MRGEYAMRLPMNSLTPGSPPLAWGILRGALYWRAKDRITPTCVGNTGKQDHLSSSRKDHPHLRGEYEIMTQVDKGAKGPPPLAWGILITAIEHRPNMGITPTCVGNT